MNFDNKEINQNRIKALSATIIFHAALILLFFLVSFTQPQTVPPVQMDEGIEVNLGNSDIGFGDIQPLVPGEPAPDASSDNSNSTPSVIEEIPEPETEIAENETTETPVIHKPEIKNKPVIKKTETITKPVNQTTKTNSPVNNPVSNPDPKPKAVFKGGNGSGGNNADEFNNSSNQGIAEGNGDQGKKGGDPKSDNYTGNGGSGNGGPSVIKGNRKITNAGSFTGDLPKAIILASISVDANGKGTFQKIEKGSTSFDNSYATSIRNYLPRISFNKSAETSTVTVRFVFDVKH
jgi:outer membrane biosynthesis protein TonB